MASLKPINQIISESDVLINNALSDEAISTELALFGYDETKLNEGKALLDEVIELNRKQEKEKGKAESATMERNLKINELLECTGELREVAKIALEENEQWLEKLGILARSDA
ncbi:MAG: hypothetical protein PVH88_05940 [Ignavibacteria bacterium]|jgi:hypothetical protein